jgi:hypothetical protein
MNINDLKIAAPPMKLNCFHGIVARAALPARQMAMDHHRGTVNSLRSANIRRDYAFAFSHNQNSPPDNALG